MLALPENKYIVNVYLGHLFLHLGLFQSSSKNDTNHKVANMYSM